MPWDEPGSGRDDRGSGGRGGRGGPPELDDFVKVLRDKFSGAFSGGDKDDRSNGSSRRKPPPPFMRKSRRVIFGIAAAAVVVLWSASGFYVVEQGERGVELRFGEYLQTKDAGLRWHVPYPVDEVLIVNIQKVDTVEVGYRVNERTRTITPVQREALMLTADENIIDIQFAVQYDIKDPKDLLFNVSDPLPQVVRQATESAVREIVGGATMDFAITEGRAEIAQGTKFLLQQILDRYKTGVNVRTVEMQNAQPPSEVKSAFDDAVKAREDEERLKNEAEAYFNDVIPRARGEAARILQEAEGYKASVIARAEGEASRFEQIYNEYRKAPDITRDRLYIESLENVLSGSTKLLIDQRSGNNILYLPLDQLLPNGDQGAPNSINRQRAGAAAASTGSNFDTSSSPTRDDSRQGRG